MFGAHMILERFVALPLVSPFHFINCVADERPRRFELSATGRTHPSLKMLLFNPYQLAAMTAGLYTRTFDLCRTQKRCHEGPLPCVLVKNEVLSGR